MKSTMESKNYHELQRRLYYRMPRFFSRKNIVIMICRSGRHRSVENAELWSNTLARYSRHQHSASVLHLSELDFWKIRVRENVRNAVNSLPEFSRHTTIASVLSVHDLIPCPNLRLVTGSDHDLRTSVKVRQETRVLELMRKVGHDPPRIRSMEKITFYKRRKSERQVPHLRLLERT